MKFRIHFTLIVFLCKKKQTNSVMLDVMHFICSICSNLPMLFQERVYQALNVLISCRCITVKELTLRRHIPMIGLLVGVVGWRCLESSA